MHDDVDSVGLASPRGTARPTLRELKTANTGGDFWLLPETRLRLETALLRSPPRLGEVTSLAARDPEAVLQIFALAAGEGALPTGSVRLEDCVAAIGPAELRKRMCGAAALPRAEPATLLQDARQSVLLAQKCAEVAETLGLPVEHSFLVGLLAWNPARTACCDNVLPHTLRTSLEEVQRGEPASPWTAVFQAALELLWREGSVQYASGAARPGSPDSKKLLRMPAPTSSRKG